MTAIRALFVSLALFGSACAAQAQVAPPPAATIDGAAWLAGRWVGTGFGGQMEETWSPPVGGQMIGHFRYWREGEPQFYEIMMMDDDLRVMVMNEASTAVLRAECRRKGMRTLRECGLLAIYEGMTTIAEVVRATLAAE